MECSAEVVNYSHIMMCLPLSLNVGSRDSSVYSVWIARLVLTVRERDVSLPYSVQVGFGAHPAYYPPVTGSSYSEDKAAGARS
jgi:hypothetical protein